MAQDLDSNLGTSQSCENIKISVVEKGVIVSSSNSRRAEIQ
jgi:hypothetical protein